MTHNTNDNTEPQVPEGVLRGIDDIENGRTMSKTDIERVLKF